MISCLRLRMRFLASLLLLSREGLCELRSGVILVVWQLLSVWLA
jgi:hypothetical protein